MKWQILLIQKVAKKWHSATFFAAFFLSHIFQEKAILHRRISDFFIHEKLAFIPLVSTYFQSGILMIFKSDFEVADLW